jgi:hypothetical protein
MFWELQEANAAKVEGFRRDYCDATKSAVAPAI